VKSYLISLITVLLILSFSLQLSAQSIDVGYLNPAYGNSTYKYFRLGSAANYFGGIMHNHTSANYGDGNDLSIFTYGNRDITLRTGTGKFIVFPTSGGYMGVGTKTPTQKLDVNGNIRATGGLITGNRQIYFGTVQRLYGNNSASLHYRSNHNSVTNMQFRDKDNTLHGYVYGSSNGTNFGLLDGDGNWAFQMVKDNYTAFKINNAEKMRIKSNGYVGIGTTNPTAKLQVIGAVRASYAANEYFDIGHGGANAYLNNVGDGNIELRHEGSTKFILYPDGNMRVYGLTGSGNRMVAATPNGTLTTRPMPATVFSFNGNNYPFNNTHNQILIGANDNKFTNIPVASRSKLYVKNDNDEMLAFERVGVNHIFEFRMGTDGHLVLGKRTSGNNNDRKIVMRFDNDSGSNYDKKAEFQTTKVYASEMEVNPAGKAPDYVFQEDYSLKTLEEVEQFVQQHKHLPDFPN